MRSTRYTQKKSFLKQEKCKVINKAVKLLAYKLSRQQAYNVTM